MNKQIKKLGKGTLLFVVVILLLISLNNKLLTKESNSRSKFEQILSQNNGYFLNETSYFVPDSEEIEFDTLKPAKYLNGVDGIDITITYNNVTKTFSYTGFDICKSETDKSYVIFGTRYKINSADFNLDNLYVSDYVLIYLNEDDFRSYNDI